MVCTSVIWIGGAGTVAGSGAIVGAVWSDGCEFSSNVRGSVLKGITVSRFFCGMRMDAEPAATPELALARAWRSGVSPTRACAGRYTRSGELTTEQQRTAGVFAAACVEIGPASRCARARPSTAPTAAGTTSHR